MAEETIPPVDEQKTIEDQLAEQKQITAEQNEKIAQLTELVATKTTDISVKTPALPVIPKANLKVGKKEYRWNVPVFKMPGSTETITAEAANTDKDLIAEILKIEGQGLLTELV